MIQMWVLMSADRFVCCICHCFKLALFMQDHGFDPPYGSNNLPVVNSLYAYTETSTLEEILCMRQSRHEHSQKNTKHCEDQCGLVKLARVTRY